MGKVAGIKLFMHWTFPLIIVWIIFTNLGRGLNSGQVAWAVVFTLTVFICVILHELGHALAAKRYHIQTKDITLFPIGGVARLEKMPDKPIQELIVALAGPAVNFIIVILLFIFLRLTKLPTDLSVVTHISAGNFLLSLAIINLWLALFNLIPAFPMDGGRVLRALLSLRLNRVLATNIAAKIGQVLAIVFAFIGFFYSPFLILIALFVFWGATEEAEQMQIQSVLKNRTVAEVTMKQIPVLKRTDTIASAVELLLAGQAKNFLVMDDEQPFGTLSREGIIKALQKHTNDALVEVVADRNLGYIEVAESIESALSQMRVHNYALLLVKKHNQLYGVIDMENILEYIMVLNASVKK